MLRILPALKGYLAAVGRLGTLGGALLGMNLLVPWLRIGFHVRIRWHCQGLRNIATQETDVSFQGLIGQTPWCEVFLLQHQLLLGATTVSVCQVRSYLTTERLQIGLQMNEYELISGWKGFFLRINLFLPYLHHQACDPSTTR